MLHIYQHTSIPLCFMVLHVSLRIMVLTPLRFRHFYPLIFIANSMALAAFSTRVRLQSYISTGKCPRNCIVRGRTDSTAFGLTKCTKFHGRKPVAYVSVIRSNAGTMKHTGLFPFSMYATNRFNAQTFSKK